MGTSEIMSPGETSDFGELGYSGESSDDWVFNV